MKTTKTLAALAALTTLALAACGGKVEPEADAAPAATAAPAPATTDAPAMTDDDIEILSMDMSWDPDAVCPPYNTLRESGIDLDVLNDFLIDQFEEGYESPLSAAGRAHLIELVSAC